VDVLLIALILSCSVHTDDHLVEALAAKLSLDNLYFVGDLSNLNTYDNAHSVADAKKVVDAIVAKGGRPAVGYLSVPIAWATHFGRSVDDLFDGCTNIGVATAMLSEFERACTIRPAARSHSKHHHRRGRPRPGANTAIRYCIVRHLETELAITGIVEHVLPEAAKPRRRSTRPGRRCTTLARAPLFPDNTDIARLHEVDDWSSQRLFVPSPTVPPTAPLTVRPSPSPSPPPAAAAKPAQQRPAAARL
jgi:hypothetical protein